MDASRQANSAKYMDEGSYTVQLFIQFYNGSQLPERWKKWIENIVMLSFEIDIVIFYCHTYAEEELYEGKHGSNVGWDLPGYGTDTGGHGGLEKWQIMFKIQISLQL